MKKRNSGTTLVELIAVMAIMVLVSSIIYTLFSGAGKIYRKTHEQIILQDEMRLLSSSLEDDIRIGYTQDVEIQPSNDKVKFKMSNGTEFVSDFTTLGIVNPKVEYAFISGAKYYSYVSYDDSAAVPVKRTIAKYESTNIGINEFLKYTNKIEAITCVKRVAATPAVYNINIELKDKSGNEFGYSSTISPRNK